MDRISIRFQKALGRAISTDFVICFIRSFILEIALFRRKCPQNWLRVRSQQRVVLAYTLQSKAQIHFNFHLNLVHNSRVNELEGRRLLYCYNFQFN